MAGAYGHINHIYECDKLTFKNLKDIINGLQTKTIKLFEKYDGQNLMVTIKNRQVLCARNKGTLMNPMTLAQLCNMYSGRSEVLDSFVRAFIDMSDLLIDSLDHQFFEDGKVFINIEIINQNTRNIIYYDNRNYLILTDIIRVDSDGNILGKVDKSNLQFLSTQLPFQGNTYLIDHYNEIDYNLNCQDVINDINNYMDLNEITDSDLLIAPWVRFLMIKIDSLKITPSQKKALVDRWVYGDKSVKLVYANYGMAYSYISLYEKEEMLIDKNNVMLDLKKLITDLSLCILKNITGSLSDINNVTPIIDYYINCLDLCEKGNINIDKHLNLIKLYDIKNILNIEGVVFNYNDHQLKLTGLFAPINQICGIHKYTRK